MRFFLQVNRVQDVLEMGQLVEVKYLGKDKRNFHKISHKACLPAPPTPQPSADTEHKPSNSHRVGAC